jgi:hypothetical protein
MTVPPVPPDPALPHLPEALDPATMLPVLERCFSGMGEVDWKRCAVDRVRYRPGARAFVQYTARTVDRSTGEERDRWITALLYPRERTLQVWGKLSKAVSAGAAGGDGLSQVALVPDRDLILQVFPFDRRLRSLPVLMEPERLAGRVATSGGHGPWTAEPIRYRAGLGCALRWNQESNGGVTRYVKAYRDGQGALTHEVLLSLRAARQAGEPGADAFDVPEPLAYLKDHLALVQHAVSGRSLADHLLEADDPGPMMRRVGGALAVWHSPPPPPTSRRRAASAELNDVRRAAALVSTVRPPLTEAMREVVARVAGSLNDVEPAPTHGDLKPDHVLIDGDRTALLDLDSFAGGDPVLDVGSMLASLADMAMRQVAEPARLAAAANAFAETYFEAVPARWRNRLPSHHAAALLQEAAGCFRLQLAEWPALMGSLVEHALQVAG